MKGKHLSYSLYCILNTIYFFLEFDLNILPFLRILKLKEGPRFKTKQVGNQIGWENLQFSIEVTHVAVIEPARSLDFVLCV